MGILNKFALEDDHTSMNTQRSILALLSAALFSFAAAPVSSGIVYDLNATQSILVDTLQGPIYFSTDFTRTTGTGVLDPFLSIQGSPESSGYNLSAGVLDTKRNGQFTRTQTMADLQTITVNGIDYYSFLLDINESASTAASKISLDALKIYTGSVLQTSLNSLQINATLRIDIDSQQDNTLLYDYKMNSGSGEGDIAFLVPVSAFAGAQSTDFFYLYQEFGGYGPAYNSEAGFEETRHAGDITFVPIPETKSIFPILAVLGVVVAGPFIRRCFHP